MLTALSPEFELVAACCVWPPSPARTAAILAAASGPTDWARVADIARRQRVEGLVQAGLAGAGATPTPAVAEALAEKALEIAQQSLTQAAESARLQALIDGAGIPNLLLKGAAVEMLAYGALGLKQAWDIDLLVAPDRALHACELLRVAGYDLIQPRGLTSTQFSAFVALARECEFSHRETGIKVELHWGLVDGPVLLAAMTVASPAQWVTVTDSLRLRTLAREELLAYLCVHGAMHGWARLKWLADLAAILARESPESIEQLYRRSLELGAGLCPGQALLLCERLLGTPISPLLAAELRAGATVTRLERYALETMTADDPKRHMKALPFAARRLWLELALVGSWRGAVGQLRYRAISVHDHVHVPLPAYLRFLYPLMRGPMWLGRRLIARESSVRSRT